MAEREIKLSMSTLRWLIGGTLAITVAGSGKVWELYAENQELKLELRLVQLELDKGDAAVETTRGMLEALR